LVVGKNLSGEESQRGVKNNALNIFLELLPEEQLTSLILVARDRKKTSIALSNVERHIRQTSTVHNELLSSIVQEVVSALPQAGILELLVRNPLLDNRLLGALGLREGLLGRV
jgi:hypothetical protein